MIALGQIGAVTLMSLRNIPQRLGASLVIVVGMAAVVGVVISVLSMSAGFLETVNKTGKADHAIVMSSGSIYRNASKLPRDNVPTIMDGANVVRDKDGKPIASVDVFAYLQLVKKADGFEAPVTIHGVGPQAFALMPAIRIVSGRMFKPALHELVVGRMTQSQFTGLDVGDRISLPEGDWTIVGSFASDGDQHESELLGDAETLLSAYRRNSFNSVTVLLDRPQSFDTFKDSMTSNPTLSVDVVRENDYFAKLSKPMDDFLKLVAYVVGGIMTIGAVVSALNTMYSAVSTRSIEIATLRAIGFGAVPLVISIFAESTLLALLGAVIGASAAWVLFNGHMTVSSLYIFALSVTPALVARGVGLALIVGIVGGLFPAMKAARLPVAAALRAV